MTASVESTLLVMVALTPQIYVGNPTKPEHKMLPKDLMAILQKKVTVDPLLDPGDHYDPHYGYEPYWPGGEWKIRDPWEWADPNVTTTPIPTICGDECNYLYASIGAICAHQMGLSANVWDWCYPETCGKHENFMDLTRAFVTFPTYCSYLDAQCKAPKNKKWGLVHIGPCIQQKYIYKPNSLSEYSMARMKTYLSTLKARMSEMGRAVDVD